MSMKKLALAALAAAGIGFAGVPANADGVSFSIGIHGGHFGHGFHHRHRHFGHFGHRHHFRRHHRRHRFFSHFGLNWWPVFPSRPVYVYPEPHYAPGYAAPVYPAPPPAVTTAYCREYTRNVIVNGRPAHAYGRACRQPDGSWRIVNER